MYTEIKKITIMKKKYFLILLITGIGITMFFNSCAPTPAIIARNTVDVASLEEINLERKDYEIIDVITASATVTFDARNMRSTGENHEFVLQFNKFKGTNELLSGMLHFGYFSQYVVSNYRV